jgi:hypothetical protein
MRKRLITRLFSAFIYFLLFSLQVKEVWANPYFYITGNTLPPKDSATVLELHLNTDGNQIGALQGVVNFSTEYFDTTSISVLSSVCSLWAPANSTPPGQNLTRVSPYFYNGKVIFSCGITGSGYKGSDGLVGKISLTPKKTGSTSLTLSDAYFAFLGSSIAPGAMSNFDLVVQEASAAATPTPTASATAAPTPIVRTTTVLDDVNIVEVEPVSRTGRSSSGTSGDTDLEVVDEDDAIPAPPADMTPRPKATPFRIAEMNASEPYSGGGTIGEVMAVQGLRDLLIPGKSRADKTVVLINFISTLTFLIVLAVVLWKLLASNRSHKIKTHYIQELISGELAAIEGKMSILNEKEGKNRFESEFSQTVKNILEEVENPNKKS